MLTVVRRVAKAMAAVTCWREAFEAYWATVHFYRKKCSMSHGALSRKRNAFCRKHRFLKSTEHIHDDDAQIEVLLARLARSLGSMLPQETFAIFRPFELNSDGFNVV